MPNRPSQIVCTVTMVYVKCTQTMLHLHDNSCMLLIPLCKNNLNLPVSHTDRYALRKLKTTATTAFLIFNTVVPNPNNHSTTFDPQSSAPLKVHLKQIHLSLICKYFTDFKQIMVFGVLLTAAVNWNFQELVHGRCSVYQIR